MSHARAPIFRWRINSIIACDQNDLWKDHERGRGMQNLGLWRTQTRIDISPNMGYSPRKQEIDRTPPGPGTKQEMHSDVRRQK